MLFNLFLLISCPAPKPCDNVVDVAFLVDASGTIGLQNFEKEKAFVKRLAQRLSISPSDSRAAVVLYSSTASVKAQFGNYNSTGSFGRAVDKLAFIGGKTMIDKALSVAASEIFPNARPGVDKIAILLTDGYQTSAPGAKSLKEASEPLRKAGVRVMVVGIGGDLETKGLLSLVETKDDFFIARSFDELTGKTDSVATTICGKSNCCIETVKTKGLTVHHGGSHSSYLF